MRLILIVISILAMIAINTSCKKCTTCTAHDSSTGDIKFEEKSCSKGPLLDNWKKGIMDAYPLPQYNTTCK